MIYGDFLIDDKPNVTGKFFPKWKHLVFERAYNQNSQRTKVNWENWERVLKEEFKIIENRALNLAYHEAP